MAVGYWKTPTESTYLAPGDTSQNQHIEGLPFGTRGGMLVHHFGEVTHQPERIWFSVAAVGIATAALLWIYDKTFRTRGAAPAK